MRGSIDASGFHTGQRLHLVLGKGGVGKSTVAAAMAVALAAAGRRTLAVELETSAGLSRVLGVGTLLHGQVVAARPLLSVELVNGRAALAEYLRLVLRVDAVVSAIVSHPVYRAFVGAAPGVRELMALGKIRDELRRTEHGAPVWDAIVVDAGASGHALGHLRMPAAAARAFGSGLVRGEAEKIRALLADRSTTRIHIVALPEAMPVDEAITSAKVVRGELGLPLAHPIVNRCRELPPAGASRLVERLESMAHDPAPAEEELARSSLATAARRALAWIEIQERAIARLEGQVGPALRLPRLGSQPIDAKGLLRLASALREAIR